MLTHFDLRTMATDDDYAKIGMKLLWLRKETRLEPSEDSFRVFKLLSMCF